MMAAWCPVGGLVNLCEYKLFDIITTITRYQMKGLIE